MANFPLSPTLATVLSVVWALALRHASTVFAFSSAPLLLASEFTKLALCYYGLRTLDRMHDTPPAVRARPLRYGFIVPGRGMGRGRAEGWGMGSGREGEGRRRGRGRREEEGKRKRRRRGRGSRAREKKSRKGREEKSRKGKEEKSRTRREEKRKG